MRWIILLLSAVKLGIGGFSMGAATALYSATCHALGKYGNGNLYQVNLQSVIALSGWLPYSGYASIPCKLVSSFIRKIRALSSSLRSAAFVF